jgi:hypothetical protein
MLTPWRSYINFYIKKRGLSDDRKRREGTGKQDEALLLESAWSQG